MTKRLWNTAMPRSVARLVAAGAVALVVLAGSLGSTAAEERHEPMTQAPEGSRPVNGWLVDWDMDDELAMSENRPSTGVWLEGDEFDSARG